MNIPSNPTESVKRINPHVWINREDCGKAVSMTITIPKRIRQSSRPLMNHLEREFYERFPISSRPRPQAVRFRLANGLTFTPDFYHVGTCTAWEVKGKHAWDDALVKLKVAAHEWPEVVWILVWKDKNGQWQEQFVKP